MTNKTDLELVRDIAESKLNERVTELNYLDRGACNNIFYLGTEANSYIIKQERTDKLDSEKNDLGLESKILKTIEKKNLKFIPQVIFITDEPATLCYRYIAGVPLNVVWQSLSEKERDTVMQQLGKFYATLHSSVQTSESNLLGITNNEDTVYSISSKIRSALNTICLDGDPLFQALSKIEASYKLLKNHKASNGFLHGDAHQGNILIYNKELAGVMDFGDCEVGNVNKDFSHFARHYPNYLDILIKSYEDFSTVKLSKKEILLWGMLADMERIIYHVKKIAVGKEKFEGKLAAYYSMLDSTD